MIHEYFDTPIWKTPIVFAGEKFDAEFGVLPEKLCSFVKLIGVDWVLGSDVLKRHPMFWDLPNGKIQVLNSNSIDPRRDTNETVIRYSSAPLANGSAVTFKFKPHRDHILINDDGKWLFIDTGCGVTIGDTPTLVFGGRRFPCVNDYHGFSSASLTDFIGHQIDYLIGQEVLNHFPFYVDWGKEEITFYPTGHRFEGGHIVPLFKDPLTGVLLKFPFKFNGREIVGIWDSGCPVSYMEANEGKPAGTARDFYPGYGRWETKLYKNQVDYGDRKFEMPFGIVPPACILKYAAPWLCGAEFMKSGPTGIDIANMRLHLFPKISTQERPEASESLDAASHELSGNNENFANLELAMPGKEKK